MSNLKKGATIGESLLRITRGLIGKKENNICARLISEK